MFDEELMQQASALVELLRSRGLKLASAESCTGGLFAGLITSIAGSSDVFERGFVTYSNSAKMELLDVDPVLIARTGAVSAQTAAAMAAGLLDHARADIGVSITGVAGPGGGTEAKPVGLVHFGLCRKGVKTRTFERRFGDLGRQQVRLAAVAEAAKLVIEAARDQGAP